MEIVKQREVSCCSGVVDENRMVLKTAPNLRSFIQNGKKPKVLLTNGQPMWHYYSEQYLECAVICLYCINRRINGIVVILWGKNVKEDIGGSAKNKKLRRL